MYHLYCLSFFLLLLSCGNPQQDQIIEVTRLDILRKKTQEILTEQKIRVESAVKEFDAYSVSGKAHLSQLAAQIKSTEKSLNYWRNWHVNEEKKRRREARSSRYMDSISTETNLAATQYALPHLIQFKRDFIKAKDKAIVGVNYLQLVDSINVMQLRIAQCKTDILQYMEKLKRYKTNPKLVYKKPKVHIAEITDHEEQLEIEKQLYDKAATEFDLKYKSYVGHIAKMKRDLKITLAAYDSINAMHTNAVFELSKANK